MGLLKSLSNPQEYLKITGVFVNTVPSTMNAENPCDQLPARVDFTITFNTFESYEKRVESDTNPYIVKLSGSRTINFIPDAPTSFVGTDYQKLIAKGYVGLKSLEEFGNTLWEDTL